MKMRRARQWFVALLGSLLIAGCASSSETGGESMGGDDVLWTGIYLGAIVLGIAGAKMLVESNE
jgi:hypothetical protein